MFCGFFFISIFFFGTGYSFFSNYYSITPLIRKLVIRNANYLDRLGPSGNIVENSKIRRGRKV